MAWHIKPLLLSHLVCNDRCHGLSARGKPTLDVVTLPLARAMGAVSYLFLSMKSNIAFKNSARAASLAPVEDP